MVKTLPSHAAQEPLADCIRLWRTIGYLQDFNRCAHGNAREAFPVLAIAIPNQKVRRLTERRCLAQLLGHPGVRWRTRDAEMNNPPRSQLDDEKEIERTKPKVNDG